MIDFTARTGLSSSDRHLKHYVAVYDPTSSQLQITEARGMTVRGCVRQAKPESDDDGTPEVKATSNYSGRAALTHAFGTKKSRKAVQSFAENTLLSGGANDVNDPLSAALLSSMPAQDIAEGAATSTASLIQANKPLPMPDLTTDDISLVYPYSSLVFPAPASSTLENMPVQDWQTKIAKKEPIECISRFVANRSTHIVKAANTDPNSAAAQDSLRTLRYILLLVELSYHLKTIRSDRRLPPTDQWASMISGSVPPNLVGKIVHHFCPNGLGLSNSGTTLLQTTILALTLRIPPPSGVHGAGVLITEPSDIQQDLNLKPEQVRHLYKELGCKIESGTDAELQRWGYAKRLAKVEGALRPKFAKLRFPLSFPTLSKGAPLNRKRK